MSRDPLVGDLSGHRVDAEEAENGFVLMFKGQRRNMVKMDEDELAKWLADRRHKMLTARKKEKPSAFTLLDQGDDVDFRLAFSIW